MTHKLWKFTDNRGTFESYLADKIKSLYFPLCNETLLSSVSPTLHGDIKTSHNSFLLIPVSRIDLVNLRSSRNFWIYLDKHKIWSASGVSKDLKQIEQDSFKLEAGLIWHKVTRENRHVGLRAEILSFVPASHEPVEIMVASFTNISSQKIKFIPTAAIPIYARGANNLRDHRQVTSLLQRITVDKFGVVVKPTLVFDETGHKPNKTIYFVLGWDEKFKSPQYIYPTQEMFCGDGGDLEAPHSIFKNILPAKLRIQGREAMGALRFNAISLNPGQARSYIVLMGIVDGESQIPRIIQKFRSLQRVQKAFQDTKDFWVERSNKISVSTGNSDFDNWFRWVSIQPVLRKIFGCSFLPDFDYGKGGRGWRDLWQDSLNLILNNPNQARSLLINNFSGVRIDGSHATIIGKKPGEFLADRNNISRVWMDHGIWPLLTLDLYMHETGDFDILLEETSYFRDHLICRCRQVDPGWNASYGNKLKSSSGKIYTGTVFEHLLVENLVPFFNVGPHNFIRLEGADWNDGLDMAGDKGESVTFSAMYAHNLKLLSDLLLRIDKPKITIAKELNLLLGRISYNNVREKLKALDDFFFKTKSAVSGVKIAIDTAVLSDDLRRKSLWLMNHIRENEWLKPGFFNGYYDNASKRVEGKQDNLVRMTLSSQVFPIMSEAAQDWQIEEILDSAEKHLWDKKQRGFHLNTDFRGELHNLGRAFSFVYGDKENGAFFNHMIVMFAFALYKRKFPSQGWQVLSSIYRMALDTEKSKIYPGLPEYFNLEGRGMYSYLTGSASWFVLTLLTQVFGVKGKDGDLLIQPKLCREQFNNTRVLHIKRTFAGRCLEIKFFNPKKLDYGRYKIIRTTINSRHLPLKDSPAILISRKTILSLPANKINKLDIHLG
jgi:cellobiose phosphorylase